MTSRLRALARAHAGSATSLVVLAIAANAILGRVGTFDLGFDDECYLLDAGLGLPTRPLPPAEYGALYAVWYRLLGAFEPDPIGLYTFNWVVLQLGSAEAGSLTFRHPKRSSRRPLTVAAELLVTARCSKRACAPGPQ